ncbi:hypothetical protein ACFL0U_01000 [Pseudomonadota bacterium]
MIEKKIILGIIKNKITYVLLILFCLLIAGMFLKEENMYLQVTQEEILVSYNKALDKNLKLNIKATDHVVDYYAATKKELVFFNNIAISKYSNIKNKKEFINKLKESISQDIYEIKGIFSYIKDKEYEQSDEAKGSYNEVQTQLYGSKLDIITIRAYENFDKYFDIFLNKPISFNDNIFPAYTPELKDISVSFDLPVILYIFTKVISLAENMPFYKTNEIEEYYHGDVFKNSGIFHLVKIDDSKSILDKNLDVNSAFAKSFVLTIK